MLNTAKNCKITPKNCRGRGWLPQRLYLSSAGMSSRHITSGSEVRSRTRPGCAGARLLIEVLGQYVHLVLVAPALPLIPQL